MTHPVHCDRCVSHVCLLKVEGDVYGVDKGEVGTVVQEFSKSAEEAEVVEADDFGVGFSLYFQVLAGSHCMIEDTYG